MRSITICLSLVLVGLTGCQLRYRHEVEPTGTASQYALGMGDFVRYDGYDAGTTATAGDLHLATVTYTRERDSAEVILVAGFPMADASYFAAVNELLADREQVLYEEPILENDQGGSYFDAPAALLGLQGNQSLLDLDADHWVSCDMLADSPMMQEMLPLDELGIPDLPLPSPDQVESFAELAFQVQQTQRLTDFAKHRAAVELANSPSGIPTERLGSWMDRLVELIDGVRLYLRKEEDRKQAEDFVQQIDSVKKMMPFFAGILIEQRNAYVSVKVGQATNKGVRKLAIYYNAWHAEDLGKRLEKRGFVAGERVWLPAWNMNSR